MSRDLIGPGQPCWECGEGYGQHTAECQTGLIQHRQQAIAERNKHIVLGGNGEIEIVATPQPHGGVTLSWRIIGTVATYGAYEEPIR